RKTFDLYSLDKWKNTNICGRLTKDLCTENELLHWHFFPGKTTFDIEDIIGGVKLDAVFIDGAHAHPYPLLDLLFLLPYLHEESLIIFHDVNNYPFIGELGACYIFSAWPPMYRYLNFYVDNPNIEPITQEYMGVCTLPSREQLLEILLSVAMFPIDAPWEKYGSWKNPLGLEPNDMEQLLSKFMSCHYPEEFTEKFINTLLQQISIYKKYRIYREHHTRIFNDAADIKVLRRRVKCLEGMLTSQMLQGNSRLEKGKKYVIFGSGGRYQEAAEKVYKAGAVIIAVIDLQDGLYGHTWYDYRIMSSDWLPDHKSEYDGVVIASIDDMLHVYNSITMMGVPKEKIYWVELWY
ncbi:MAG: hypothetical protein IKO94_01315, partial [Selenomonadaceae bacterium]|nr:hypothetical protein [Selenomonadaceae bacterium]